MTTRFEVWVGRGLTYLFAFLSVLLAFYVWIKIDAAKNEIISQIEILASERKAEIAVLTTNLNDLRGDMDKHREWSRTIDSDLVRRESTWIDRTEFIEWCEEAKKLNPSLAVPAIEAIKHTRDKIEKDAAGGSESLLKGE